MKTKPLLKVIFALSLLFALFFAATSWMWGYLANLYYAVPAAIISVALFIFAHKRDEQRKKYKIIVGIWAFGCFSALITFFVMLL